MTDTQDTNRRIDTDRLAPEASPSAGWRETYAIFHVNMDQFAAATRTDRPERYRRKHIRGVSS